MNEDLNPNLPKTDAENWCTEDRTLKCRLTEAELEEEAKKLTAMLVEKSDLEARKRSSNQAYAEAIKALDIRIEDQIPIVRDREIERRVECLVEFNTPEKGFKRVTRRDTGEVIFTGEMTSDECQDLFLNAADDEADAAETVPPETKPLPCSDEAVINVASNGNSIVETEPGRLYNVNGKTVRAVSADDKDGCHNCVFDEDNESCGCFNCDNTIFRPADEKPADEKPADDLPPACSHCGKTCEVLYHVDNERLLCVECMEHTTAANRAAQFLAEKHEDDPNNHSFGFRAQFGYGCRMEHADTTCFRIRTYEQYGGACWGMHHYKPGNYRLEGTPAHEYYQHLKSLGGVEA